MHTGAGLSLTLCCVRCWHALLSTVLKQSCDAQYLVIDAQEYSTLWRSLYTMFAAAVSEFDSKTYLEHHNPGVTLPLFVIYLFIVAIILLNLLVALLTNSFQKARNPQHAKCRAHAGIALLRAPFVEKAFQVPDSNSQCQCCLWCTARGDVLVP